MCDLSDSVGEPCEIKEINVISHNSLESNIIFIIIFFLFIEYDNKKIKISFIKYDNDNELFCFLWFINPLSCLKSKHFVLLDNNSFFVS